MVLRLTTSCEMRIGSRVAGSCCVWPACLSSVLTSLVWQTGASTWALSRRLFVGTGCTAPIQLDTGTVQGSVLSPLLFDLFLNALLRLLDATGITHGIKRTPQWNHAAFADDLSIYVSTVSDGNKLLEVIHEFESWSGLRISIPKSVATGAMYGTGTFRRQAAAKADAAKRKRDAGPDILNPQIRALEAMDEALDTDNTTENITKGQEAWRTNLDTMLRQCPICNQTKGVNFFPTQLHINPPCLECKHAWKPSGIKYNATELKVTHGKAPIRLLGIRYNMWLDSAAQRRYVMDGITEMACFLRKNRDLSIENGLRLVDCTLGPLLAFSGPVIIWPEKEFKKHGCLCQM